MHGRIFEYLAKYDFRKVCTSSLAFESHAYFIEANLTKTTDAGNPALHFLRLDIVPC